MTDLAGLTDRVEQILADTANAIWDTTWISEGLRQALHEYSAARPLKTIGTLAVGSDTHELDISSISLLEVNEVHVPYTASDPEEPPNGRAFEHWQDAQILYFPGYELQSGDTARIFYTQLHTIEDLDSATATTVRADHETLLVNGAAGHVAASRAIDLTEQVTIDRLTSQQVRAWGLSKLQEFRTGLRGIARAEGLKASGFVESPALDRWDSSGGWS